MSLPIWVRRGAPFILASLALYFVPSAASEKVRLQTLSLLGPVKTAARNFLEAIATALPRRAGPSDLEKEELQSAIFQLTSENAEIRVRLESLTDYRRFIRAPEYDLVMADVLFACDSTLWRHSLTIQRGSSDGLQAGQAVTWRNHLIGRMTAVAPHSARVTLITDPSFRAAAVAIPQVTAELPSFTSREMGVLEGKGLDRCMLKWLMEPSVGEGGVVVTAEDSSAGIPKGLVLGRVVRAVRTRGNFRLEVAPIVQTRALEFVTVLRRKS